MVFEVAYPRIYPERRPAGHQPAAPRYSLRWQVPVAVVVSDYLSMQSDSPSWEDELSFFDRVRQAFDHPDGPQAHETMRYRDETGATNSVVVCYWTDLNQHQRWSQASALQSWFNLPCSRAAGCGYWRETVAVPFDRHETIYSAPGYLLGLGRTPDSVIVPIDTNGYFGAARDRLPVSAIDCLQGPAVTPVRAVPVQTKGAHLLAAVPVNLTVLRSGQHWADARQEQSDDYLRAQQPKLLHGMAYLRDNPVASGCLSLRVMANLDPDGSERRETSVLAAFHSLAHLEQWAESHESHLDIYRHAIAMGRLHQEKREVVTWHELFVLMGGDRFEYINCHSGTGLLRWAELWRRAGEGG